MDKLIIQNNTDTQLKLTLVNSEGRQQIVTISGNKGQIQLKYGKDFDGKTMLIEKK